MILRARYLLPADGPVIEDGAVRIADGFIEACGPATEIGGRADIDYGDALILPGLINAHTHLELSSLAGLVPPGPGFADWLARLVGTPGFVATREFVLAAMQAGIDESLRAGVTAVGDITRFPAWTRPLLEASGLSGVSFGEVIAIGPRRPLLAERLAAALDDGGGGNPRIRRGVSPHAPYTVEPDALAACARRAAALAAPMCIHLAESPEEERFTLFRDGPLADHLLRLGSWDDEIPIPGCRPVELATRTGLLTRRAILAHANYVSDDDIAAIARSGASVAYCPRTHAAFGHPPHRFPDMLAAGVNVCLGTDSLASNPGLSLLDEMRCVHRLRPEILVETLARMATSHGAIALGLASSCGALRPGAAADLCVVACVEPASHSASFLRAEAPPLAVYLRGRALPRPA